MNEERLVKMANEISDFFRLKPEEEAVAGAADHIKMFWEPRMRAQMAAHLSKGGKGLKPLARKAAERACPPATASK